VYILHRLRLQVVEKPIDPGDRPVETLLERNGVGPPQLAPDFLAVEPVGRILPGPLACDLDVISKFAPSRAQIISTSARMLTMRSVEIW